MLKVPREKLSSTVTDPAGLLTMCISVSTMSALKPTPNQLF